MNSSISSSDAARAWWRFAARAASTAGLALAAVVAVGYAIDPYDTGRSTLFAKEGVRPQGPRTAVASRGRDPAFNAAIIGNSHIQLLSPESLKAKTGLAFVQLSIPATNPKEQLLVADWFLRHRQSPARALVLGLDHFWCGGDPDFANDKPFPFWLLSRNPFEYAAGLVRYDVVEELPRRLSYVFSPSAERARPDGYWNYEPDYVRLGYDSNPSFRAKLDIRVDPSAPLSGTGRFPGADLLRQQAVALPKETMLIGVFPPVYHAGLPPEGSPRHRSLQACKAALSEAVRAHANSAVIDWTQPLPENRNPAWFFDQTHYRLPLAARVEDDIAKVLKSGAAPAF